MNWGSGSGCQTHSQVSELGQVRPERVIHRLVNWGSGGQTHSQVSELGQGRPDLFTPE